jgi:hypothetical protein
MMRTKWLISMCSVVGLVDVLPAMREMFPAQSQGTIATQTSGTPLHHHVCTHASHVTTSSAPPLEPLTHHSLRPCGHHQPRDRAFREQRAEEGQIPGAHKVHMQDTRHMHTHEGP